MSTCFCGQEKNCDSVLVANEVVDLRFKSDSPIIMCKLDMEKVMTMFILGLEFIEEDGFW